MGGLGQVWDQVPKKSSKWNFDRPLLRGLLGDFSDILAKKMASKNDLFLGPSFCVQKRPRSAQRVHNGGAGFEKASQMEPKMETFGEKSANGEVCFDCTGMRMMHMRPSRGAPEEEIFENFFGGPSRSLIFQAREPQKDRKCGFCAILGRFRASLLGLFGQNVPFFEGLNLNAFLASFLAGAGGRGGLPGVCRICRI